MSTPLLGKEERKAIDLVTKMIVIKQYKGGKWTWSHVIWSYHTLLMDIEMIHEAVTDSSLIRLSYNETMPIHEIENLLYIWKEDLIQKTRISLFTVQMKAKSLFHTLKEHDWEDYD